MSFADTFEPADPNDWVRPVALTVTALLIAWNVSGWLIEKPNMEGAFIALITASFQTLSFNASAQMRRAGSKVQTPSVKRAHRFWKWTLFACSLWAAGCAHHAYGVIVAKQIDWGWDINSIWAALNAAPLLIVLTVAAFIEPFLPWAIETVEAAPKAPALVATPEPKPVTAPPRDVGRALARELSRQRPRGASKSYRDAAEERVVTRAPPLSETELKQAVAEMTQGGEVISIRRVAKHLGVPPSRVERSPARHVLRAVA